MKVCVLGSGSKGNCVYILNEAKKEAILVDAGLSWKKTCATAKEKDLDINLVTAIVITHEHIDHCGSAFVISKKLDGIPVYYHNEVFRLMQEDWKQEDVKVVKAFDCRIETKAFKILCFSLKHDSINPVGLFIRGISDKGSVCLVTDIGHITQLVQYYLREAQIVLLESNHDRQMLWDGSYPEHIKMRIASKIGHLCNVQTANAVRALNPNVTTDVILTHISEDNNSIDKISEAFSGIDKITIHMANQQNGSGVLTI